MEAPEKIYLFENPISDYYDDRWLSRRSGEDDVEYTRTDSFIDKACAFIRERLNFDDAWFVAIKDKVIEDFKNYMKGE